MSNVRLNWVLPNVSARQRPIKHVALYFRPDGIDEWTLLDEVEPSELTRLLPDVAPGTWHYRGIVVDAAGVSDGQGRDATITIGFDPPSPLTEFTVVLE